MSKNVCVSLTDRALDFRVRATKPVLMEAVGLDVPRKMEAGPLGLEENQVQRAGPLGLKEDEVQRPDKAAGPDGATELLQDGAAHLELTTVSGAPAGAIALNWGRSCVEHLSVSRVEVQVWEVDAASLVHFLRSISNADSPIHIHELVDSVAAVVYVPASHFKEQHEPQTNAVFTSRLLHRKVIPAHLGTAAVPAPIVIEGLPKLLPVAVCVRLIGAHSVPRNLQHQGSAWVPPLVLVGLGQAPEETSSAKNAAALCATLDEIVVRPGGEYSGITIKAWC